MKEAFPNFSIFFEFNCFTVFKTLKMFTVSQIIDNNTQ